MRGPSEKLIVFWIFLVVGQNTVTLGGWQQNAPAEGGGVKHVSRLGSSATPYWHPAHPTPFHALGRTIGVSWPMLLRELRTHCGAVLKLHAALFPDVAALLWPARVTPHLEAT